MFHEVCRIVTRHKLLCIAEILAAGRFPPQFFPQAVRPEVGGVANAKLMKTESIKHVSYGIHEATSSSASLVLRIKQLHNPFILR